jgi:HPt (histidine-containing phosphotransfer) domain-containing protein
VEPTTEPAGELPLLSPDTLSRLRGLDSRSGGALLEQLAKMFKTDTPERLAAIRAAVDSGVAHDLLQAAHSLKGSCSILGAAAMGSLCQRLESMGVNGEISGADVLLAELERRYEETLAAIEVELASAAQ